MWTSPLNPDLRGIESHRQGLTDPFTASERGCVTILFGGLTSKHERLIERLLAGVGYCRQRLPETDRAAHEQDGGHYRGTFQKPSRFHSSPASN
jgi:hypothetical protein